MREGLKAVESKWEYVDRDRQQWLREVTEDGRTIEHGPFESFGEARAFKKTIEKSRIVHDDLTPGTVERRT